MSPSSTPERLLRDLEQLADRAEDGAAFRRDALERILRAVPAHAACLAAADPGSLSLVAHTSEGIDRRGAGALYDSEYGTSGDVASHRSLAGGRPVRVLSEATRGELERSRRYRELLAPYGWRHELRAAATEKGTTWGFLHLYRRAGAPDFTADEAALVARAAPLLARGLREVVLRPGIALVPASSAPAMWVLDARHRLVLATPGSQRLLDTLRDDELPGDEVPEVLVGLAALARAAGGTDQVARAQVPTLDGTWLTLHASPLIGVEGDTSVAIIAQPATASDARGLALLAYRLTPAERRTVELVLAGRSTKQIAEELVLSAHTVQDRMQDVFAKVGVRSRRELVAALGA